MRRMLPLILLAGCTATVPPTLFVSGDEAKLTMVDGKVVPATQPAPDRLELFVYDAGKLRSVSVIEVPNSVVGPPSNIGITSDGARALVASSVKLDADAERGWSADDRLFVVDLATRELVDAVLLGEVPESSTAFPSAARPRVCASRSTAGHCWCKATRSDAANSSNDAATDCMTQESRSNHPCIHRACGPGRSQPISFQ